MTDNNDVRFKSTGREAQNEETSGEKKMTALRNVVGKIKADHPNNRQQ